MSRDPHSSSVAPVSIDALWSRYAATWSLPDDVRLAELAGCVSEDVGYCDPQETVTGREALSTYMGHFQDAFPGTAFRIESVLQHHDRTLAAWSLRDPADTVHQRGTSYASVTQDGRLGAITGFFEPPAGP
jgi:hypothetical protein